MFPTDRSNDIDLIRIPFHHRPGGGEAFLKMFLYTDGPIPRDGYLGNDPLGMVPDNEELRDGVDIGLARSYCPPFDLDRYLG